MQVRPVVWIEIEWEWSTFAELGNSPNRGPPGKLRLAIEITEKQFIEDRTNLDTGTYWKVMGLN